MNIKPLPSEDSHACLLTTAHILAMVKAMQKAGSITITQTDETVNAFHTPSRSEVFAALSKSGDERGPWIVRHHKLLFS